MQLDTLPKIFISQVERLKSKAFLMYKAGGRWRNVSWEEVGEKVERIALGLMALGVEKGDRISGISETRPEYAYCCTAIANSGAIFAPIYHTNSANECAHVINDSGSKLVFAENKGRCEKIIDASQKTHALEKIIVFEDFESKDESLIISLNRLCELGQKGPKDQIDKTYMDRVLSVKPDEVSAIIYTSGTTGPPKGVMDTNAGIIRGVLEYCRYFPIYDNDRGISFLPMAHALELRNGHWWHIIHGITQVYAESVPALFENVLETDPTFLFTPPRFFEKHYNAISNSLEKSPGWKRKLADWCLAQGALHQDAIDNPACARWNISDKIRYQMAHLLFLRQVRQTVGGKLRWAGAGGAPIAPELLRFFRSCGIPIYEGYGQTETQGMICVNRPGANKVGTVGKPLEDIEVRIAEDGEILVKGWIQTTGYWNNPDTTAEIFKDGWLYTGDLGVMDEDGFIRITGRKKEILITSSGKNISPAYIENLLKMSRFINQAVVFGEGKTYLTALITLNREEVTKFAEEKNVSFTDFADLTRKQEVIDLIHGEIEKKNKQLARIENIRKFTILDKEFSQAHEEVTPTLKIKRNIVTQRYRDKVEAMYEA